MPSDLFSLRHIRLTLGDWGLALMIGALAAMVTGLFRLEIDFGYRALFGSTQDITLIVAHIPNLQRILIPGVGGLLAGTILWLLMRFPGGKTCDYMEVVSEGNGRIPVIPSLLQSLSSLITIVSAGSIGREGAMIQLAALSGSLLGGRWADERRLRLMTACAAAAGLASVYHTPLAGAMFVAEIVMGAMTVDLLLPLFASSVSASLCIWALGHHDAPFAIVSALKLPDLQVFLLILPVGLACGVLAPLFLGLLQRSKLLFLAISLPLPLRMALGGVLMGVIAVWVPEICGNGYAPIERILGAEPLSGPVAWVLLAKVLGTMLIVGSGAVGGLFTPTLFIGAGIGILISGLGAFLPLSSSDANTLIALVGMGAFMAAVSQAPLMAVLMVFEMTMNAYLLLPLMAGCILSYSVSRWFSSPSVYVVMNRRQMAGSDQALIAHLEPVECHLQPDSTLYQANEMFQRTRTRYLYLIDEQGYFVGAVSIHRLASEFARPAEERPHQILSLIESEFDLLPADARLKDAWNHFASCALERIPVVASLGDRRFLGVISKRRVLRQLLSMTGR